VDVPLIKNGSPNDIDDALIKLNEKHDKDLPTRKGTVDQKLES
jgi:hypothetical protein